MSKERSALYKRALDFLGRREHSEFEIFSKLKRHTDDHELIQSVVDELKSQKYLSNERYASSVQRSIANKRQGPLKLRQKLKQSQVDIVVDDAPDWVYLAFDALVKKYGSIEKRDLALQVKAMRFLASRGFTHEQTRSALKCITNKE